MLIPYSTDAPLYHYPIATGSLIAVNLLFFVSFCLPSPHEDESRISHFVDQSGRKYSVEELLHKQSDVGIEEREPHEWFDDLEPVFEFSIADRLMLQYGQGYLPWQWLTSMFMHQGVVHLIGNMMFLWAFGLLLEGKLGWLRFLAVYLLTGMFFGLVVQTMMWFSYGAALGASGVLFAMLALVVVFAPLNNFEVFFLLGFRSLAFELPILMFGFFYVAMNVFFFYFGDSMASSEGFHLLGFLVGLPIGFWMLTRGYVDCEGYDLISHFTGREGKSSRVGKAARREREARQSRHAELAKPPANPTQTLALLNRQVDDAIAQGQFDLAIVLQSKIAESYPNARWTQTQLGAIVQHFVKTQQFAKAIPLMELHIALFDQHRFLLQSKLIKIWIEQQRPRRAIRFMQGLNPVCLSEAEKSEVRRLAAVAKKQIQDGVLELE